MKKKSLITMVLSLALVAVIGVGSTLAYLSTQSNKVTNTFTVGTGYDVEPGAKAALYIDEQDILKAEGIRTEVGNKYEEILPGDTLVKDPTVHFTKGPESYIFIKVTGMSDDAQIFTYTDITLGENWEKTDTTPGYNGVYVYKGIAGDYKVTVGDALDSLFTGVELNKLVDNVQFLALKDKIANITIQAAAVQFANVADVAEALTLIPAFN